jgi:hypothetical protein
MFKVSAARTLARLYIRVNRMRRFHAGFHDGCLSIEKQGIWQPVSVRGRAFTGVLRTGYGTTGAWQLSARRWAILFGKDGHPAEGWLLDGDLHHLSDFRYALRTPEAFFGPEEISALRAAFSGFLHKPHDLQPSHEVLRGCLGTPSR